MDEAAERLFLDRFKAWSGDRTVIIATHRMRVLDIVDRIIVVHDGKIVLDQPKAAGLRMLQGETTAPAKAARA